MSECEIRIARRLAIYMLEVAEQQIDINFFQGLGLALGVLYEECNRTSVAQMKPRDLLQWALSLPQDVTFPKVELH